MRTDRRRVRLAAALLIAGLPLAAAAQPRTRPAPPPASEQMAADRPGWLVDPANGCWVWIGPPLPGAVLRWDGPCPEGPAAGRGRMELRSRTAAGDRLETYVGAMEAGRLNGMGIRTWADGARYEGEWRDGHQEGRGIQTWPDGNRYQGEWRADRRNGRGIQTWPDGERYAGEWLDDRAHGVGQRSFASGEVLTGQWVDGCFRLGERRVVVGNGAACP